MALSKTMAIVATGLLIGAAAAGRSQEAPAAVPAAPGPAAIDAIVADVEAGRYDEALTAVDRLLARPQRPETVRLLQTMRGAILLPLGRAAEADEAFGRAEAVDPADPRVALQRLDLAFDLRGVDVILPALDHLIDRYPEAARMIEPVRITELIGWLRRHERTAEADDLLIRLARVGFGGHDTGTRDNYAIEAAATALAAGRADEARALADRVNNRRELTMALTERRFEPLWPALEARVGAHMAIAEAAAVREAEAIFAAHPDDAGARRGLVQAYALAGRLADADRTGADFASDPAEMSAIDQTGAWLINDHAFVLSAMGRGAEADARLAALRSIDIEAAPWLISMVINRVSLLVGDEKWPQALALQDEAAALAERHGSPYARQLVRSLSLCALNGVGRAAERDARLAELRAHETDAPGATVSGLLCVGGIDEAERVVLRWLAPPGDSRGALDYLQPPAGTRGEESPSAGARQELLRRPAVRQALERVGRILPEAFWPERASSAPGEERTDAPHR
jgi:tetratricopeptide (TPR) repeat protein